ncbi:MAG: mechanosensitive ion channel [Endomicrobiales bacterium]|nr:mechanosensitive ion channel [Endomicrobiales bacterium]
MKIRYSNAVWQAVKTSLIPVLVFCALLGIYSLHRQGYITLSVMGFSVQKFFYTLFLIVLGLIIQRIGDGIIIWYQNNVAVNTATTLDDDLLPFIQRVMRVTIWIMVLLIILPVYGVNISALVAAIGVSSLAIGLAAKDFIANIIAGFMILLDVPFRRGDIVTVPSGEKARVLNIGIRRTMFMRDDNAVIIIPNVDLCTNKIINHSLKEEDIKK